MGDEVSVIWICLCLADEDSPIRGSTGLPFCWDASWGMEIIYFSNLFPWTLVWGGAAPILIFVCVWKMRPLPSQTMAKCVSFRLDAGAHQLRYAAQFLSAASVLCPVALAFNFGPACEVDRTCIPILRARMQDGQCIHKDILRRCSWAAKAYARAFESGHDVDAYAAWASMQRAGCSTSAGPCHTHSCNCQTPRTTADVSGSHCTIWSHMGKRRKTKSHQIFFLLSWCLWVLWAKPVFLIHENVPGFDVNFMRFLLGAAFSIVVLPADPSHVGWRFVGRRRMYIIMWMSGRVEATCCIESMHPGISF